MRCPYFKVAVATDMQFRVGILKYYDSIMYRTFDKTVAVSTELKQELVRQLQLPVEKIPVIPVCIDTRRFSPSPGAKRIHAILHIGARQEKRPDITIEAFERIAEQDDEVELWITGGLASIGTNERAKTLLSRLEKKNIDIRKRISIMGTVSKEKLAELYSMAKVTSVPSDYVVPVCSPTVIESLASGTPVVGSVSAISKDILIDGYDGFRVQTGDAATFALRLSSMISSDSVWSEMSKNAVTIAQRCDKMNVAKEYISLYKSHLNNK
jgi:glycosyltransferase involved in cell wall biosynthesis